MSVFDSFPPAYFNGISFPVESSRIIGSIRDHVHEFSHSPGGAPEKLGRRLYAFRVNANFDANFTAYPGLYPANLDALMQLFEQQTTGPFRLPQMTSEVQAYCTNWEREMSNRVRSGEKVELTFREDQSSLFLFQDLVAVQTGSIAQSSATVFDNVAFLKSQLAANPTDQNLFDALQSTVASILALQDQSELYGNRLQAQVQQLQNLCQQLDSSIFLQNPNAYTLIFPLHDLWAAAQTLGNDILAKGVQLQSYVVPFPQDIGKVAIGIYGDSTRVSDLLSLNAIENPMNVPAGATIHFYP